MPHKAWMIAHITAERAIPHLTAVGTPNRTSASRDFYHKLRIRFVAIDKVIPNKEYTIKQQPLVR